MSRIVLSSKLLDVDVECNYLAELGDLMSDTAFSLEKAWYAKIVMRPHPQAPVETEYRMRFVKKDHVIKIMEVEMLGAGHETEHPVDIPEDLDPLPIPFLTDFLIGLPSATEYI
jgi:hypothetical protein